MLDTETDDRLCSNVQDTLVYMLQALGASHLTNWLQLCKDVLSATAGMKSSIVHRYRYVISIFCYLRNNYCRRCIQ